MDQYYYELTIKIDKYMDIFQGYILDITGAAVEQTQIDGVSAIILRTQEDPTIYIEMIKSHKESLQEIFEDEIECRFSLEKKENKDWIQSYKDGFEPFKLGSFYIHATWHQDLSDAINIVIDPELSFGTGHHATTRVCLLAIEKYIKKGQTFLDVGCGSGILSIAAAKLGAEVSLCDIDALSIENAGINLKNNSVNAKEIWEGSVLESKEKYDMVVANIVSDVLIFLKKDIISRMKKDSILILSGILDKYEQKVMTVYSALTLIDKITDGEWVCLIYKKEE